MTRSFQRERQTMTWLTEPIHEWAQLDGRALAAKRGSWEVRSPVALRSSTTMSLPGETPNLTTPHGVPLCAEGLGDAARTRLARWVDELPRDVSLISWRAGEVTLRASGDASDPQPLQSLTEAVLAAFVPGAEA